MLPLLSDFRNHFAKRNGALTGLPLAVPNYLKMASGKEPALILASPRRRKSLFLRLTDLDALSLRQFSLTGECFKGNFHGCFILKGHTGLRLRYVEPAHGCWRPR